MLEGLLQFHLWQNILGYGISFQRWYCNLMLMTLMYGSFLPQALIQQNQHMKGSSWVLYSSDQRKEFGRAGHRPNASFSCGWLHIIDAGRQTALLKGGCLTLYVARYAIRLKKQLTTC
jgi:hypothetical protein